MSGVGGAVRLVAHISLQLEGVSGGPCWVQECSKYIHALPKLGAKR